MKLLYHIIAGVIFFPILYYLGWFGIEETIFMIGVNAFVDFDHLIYYRHKRSGLDFRKVPGLFFRQYHKNTFKHLFKLPLHYPIIIILFYFISIPLFAACAFHLMLDIIPIIIYKITGKLVGYSSFKAYCLKKLRA